MTEGHHAFVLGTGGVDLLKPPEPLRETFAARRTLFCRNIFEPRFLDILGGLLRRAAWTQNGVEGLLFRTTEDPARAGGAISLALRRPELMRWVEQVTGCETLVTASGRVQQIEANPDNELEWHTDLWEPTRRIGISINLGEESYEGGKFELRDRHGVLSEHRHVERGSALLFDVGPKYQHRVLPVTSGGPRRVYAGWFYKAGT